MMVSRLWYAKRDSDHPWLFRAREASRYIYPLLGRELRSPTSSAPKHAESFVLGLSSTPGRR